MYTGNISILIACAKKLKFLVSFLSTLPRLHAY